MFGPSFFSWRSRHIVAVFISFLFVGPLLQQHSAANSVYAFPNSHHHSEDFRLESINFYHPSSSSSSSPSSSSSSSSSPSSPCTTRSVKEENNNAAADDDDHHHLWEGSTHAWISNSCSMRINEKVPISLFFHGGDLQYATSVPVVPAVQSSQATAGSSFVVAMAECALLNRSQSNAARRKNHLGDYDDSKPQQSHNDVDDKEDEHDNDDDDDDDEGHSSMLSNSSLQRKGQIRMSSSIVRRGDSMVCTNQKRSNFEGKKRSSFAVSTGTRQCRGIGSNNKKNIGKTSMYDPLLLKTRGGAQMSDEFVKRLVTAAVVTLLYEGTMGHILEFLKIAMQTAEPGTKYMDIISNITSKKGIGGLWDGFIPWGVIQSIFKGGIFGLAHSIAKSQLDPLAKEGVLPELVALTLAGGIAGGFQGYVLSPTLLLKTRVMTNPVFREKMSLLRTTVLSLTIGFEVVKTEGMLALMKGSNIFALKRVFDWSTRYFFSDMFESMMIQYGCGNKGVLSPGEKIVASLLGGTASTIVTLPLDVIVAKAQDAKKAGVKVSAWDTFMKDYREGGLKQLYDANMQGFEVRLLHVCLTTVVMKTGSALMYNVLFGR